MQAIRSGVIDTGRELARTYGGNAQAIACAITEHSSLVGGVTGRTEFKRLFIDFLWIAPQWQGHGLGAEALNDENCLTLFEEELIPVCAPGLGSPAQPLTCVEELAQFSLLHRSADKLDWEKWLVANDGKPLHTYRHIPFNLDELALDAAARGLGVAMTDLTLAAESIERGALMIPFGKPPKTRGVYVLRLQPAAMAHPAFALIMQWLRDDHCTPNRR